MTLVSPLTGMSVGERVQAFVASYAAAFEALDVDRIADHFTFPLHVAGEGRDVTVTAVATRDQWTGVLEGLVRRYTELRFRTARALDVATLPVSDRVAATSVRWQLVGADGPLYEFTAIYMLVAMRDGYRICAIAHDEIARSRALARSEERN